MKVGFQFLVGRIGRFLKQGRYGKRVGRRAPVYLEVVLEYLADEVLELAGNATTNNKKNSNHQAFLLFLKEELQLLQYFTKSFLAKRESELLSVKNELGNAEKNVKGLEMMKEELKTEIPASKLIESEAKQKLLEVSKKGRKKKNSEKQKENNRIGVAVGSDGCFCCFRPLVIIKPSYDFLLFSGDIYLFANLEGEIDLIIFAIVVVTAADENLDDDDGLREFLPMFMEGLVGEIESGGLLILAVFLIKMKMNQTCNVYQQELKHPEYNSIPWVGLPDRRRQIPPPLFPATLLDCDHIQGIQLIIDHENQVETVEDDSLIIAEIKEICRYDSSIQKKC
ncbi:core histone macro-H2A.1-like [Impatiens glandulifera]|uniref:core histone macro-H2A.1-like n=1 Tax=Impatiens glandulifera TaxID=253017 RepID=UPI001FB197F7|nr:core histone macro-H2A.1-like [Impatiens glandulifera]